MLSYGMMLSVLKQPHAFLHTFDLTQLITSFIQGEAPGRLQWWPPDNVVALEDAQAHWTLITVHCLLYTTIFTQHPFHNVHVTPGYLKALNCGNSVPKPKGFWKAQASLWEAHPLVERPNLSVRGQTTLWEAHTFCKRPLCKAMKKIGHMWPFVVKRLNGVFSCRKSFIMR